MIEETMYKALRLNAKLERCTSRGGKRVYVCPECESGDISLALHFSGRIFICNTCNFWGPWRMRKSKRSNVELRGAPDER